MNSLKKGTTGVVLSFILASLLMMVWYGFCFVHPDNYFICMWGDGFKNYYTFAYYVLYDHGCHFTGMNYPFGEHVVFTDDQPALAFIFKYLGHFSLVRDHLHSLFTISTFLSLPICAAVVYLILAEYETKGIYAIVSSVFISMLSPQMSRLSGHFGLCYSYFIPLAFLLLIRASKTGRNIYLILFPISVTVFGLIHIYHLAIITFFAVFYAILYYWASPKKKPDLVFFAKQIAAALVPFILIKVFMFLTDPVTDRPDNPWGFFASCSTICGIFLIQFSFLWEFLARHFSMPPRTEGEHWSYIGIVADLILIFFIVTSLLRFSLTRRVFKGLSPSLPVAFAAAVLVLLFSFGLPFTIDGCKWLFDYTGPIKQFRAPSRFAWVFYYVSNVFVIVYISRFLSIINTKVWVQRGLAVCMFTLWFIDLNVVNNKIVHEVKVYSGVLDMKNEQIKVNQMLHTNGFSTRDFQALLYLPYFTNGSEKTIVLWGGDVMGMKVSLYTGLNMIDAELSRTSLAQVNMNLQLTGSALIHKDVLKLYPSRLPLLVAVAIHETTTPEEQELIKKGTYIGTTFVFPDTLRFYSLPLTAFDDTAGVIRSRFDHMVSSMHKHDGYLSSDSADDVVIKTYDQMKAPFAGFGLGALYLENQDTTLFEGVLPAAMDSGIYEFSIWNYGDHRVSSYPWYRITIYDPKKTQVAKYERLASQARDVFENWKRTSFRFVLPSKYCTVKIEGKGDFASYDELMIKPMNIEVLTHYQDSTLFMYNNYPIVK